jgi:phage terminase Nu1 subunit (DNA packaging protein)
MNRVTQAEFARICGINRSTVHRWIENGRIEADAQGLIDPEAAARMKESTSSPLPHHEARKAQFDAQRAAGMDNPSQMQQNPANEAALPAETASATQSNIRNDMPAAEKIGTALKLETYKLQKAKAELANLELDKAAGALVERAEVDYVLADFGNTLRGLLEGMPDRLAPAIAAHRGDVNAIHAELEGITGDLLAQIADHMKRKMEGISA